MSRRDGGDLQLEKILVFPKVKLARVYLIELM